MTRASAHLQRNQRAIVEHLHSRSHSRARHKITLHARLGSQPEEQAPHRPLVFSMLLEDTLQVHDSPATFVQQLSNLFLSPVEELLLELLAGLIAHGKQQARLFPRSLDAIEWISWNTPGRSDHGQVRPDKQHQHHRNCKTQDVSHLHTLLGDKEFPNLPCITGEG
jgi:hypothetical protein